MRDPNERQIEFWEKAALIAVDVILATETDSSTAEAVEMATLAADGLLVAWRQRFGEAAGLTSVDDTEGETYDGATSG